MKLKTGFGGTLLPFPKQIQNHNNDPGTPPNHKGFLYRNSCLSLTLLIFLLNIARANAQQISEVHIGQKVPNVAFHNLINFHSSDAKLSDFDGKLLVLDFWDTWCKACLESMPETADLKKEYGDKVQFINITPQSIEIVKSFLKRNSSVRNLLMTMEPADTICELLFPHKLVPHVVWINQKGVYLGSTSQLDLNREVIDQILKSGSASFSDPKIDYLTFNPNKNLFQGNNGGIPDVIFKSQLTHYQPGLQSIDGNTEEDSTERYYAVNNDLYSLFCHALSIQPYSLSNAQIIYSDSLSKKLFKYFKNADRKKILFCYELIYPKGEKLKASSIILNDLSRWFGISVAVIPREVDCYIIKPSGTLKLASGDSVSRNNLSDKNKSFKYIRGQWMQKLVDFLNDQPGMKPVFDETGYNGKVDLILNKDPANIDELNRCLARYGVAIETEKRLINMMVVSTRSTRMSGQLSN